MALLLFIQLDVVGKMRNAAYPVTAALLLTGCALTVAPLIPEADAIMDERLLGEWELVAERAQASVTRSDASSYAIVYVDSAGQSGTFVARLGRVGELLVLEVVPDLKEPGPGLHADLLLTGHMPMRLRIEEEAVWIAGLYLDKLEEALASGAIDLPYESGKWENVVVHGSHEMLVRELVPYLMRNDAWANEARWQRRQVETSRER